jgi:hypothetical protein
MNRPSTSGPTVRLGILLGTLGAAMGSTAAHAMKWMQLANADILKRADLVIEGAVERVFLPPDAAKRGRSDTPRDPAKDAAIDAAEVILVKPTNIFKGRPGCGLVAIVYWSDFGDREQSHFSKYEAPRHFEQGQRWMFVLKQVQAAEFDEYSAPPEARAARWGFALPSIYDAQIQSPAFAAAARKLRR